MLSLLDIIFGGCFVGVFEAGSDFLENILDFSLFELYFIGENFLPCME